ncbi:uncharacterized protein SETTUDRAFT_30682 [Exserohilum turcica Et28A]|uniref:Uncharacterized protein n=1 Tax=Exserohilum turcicum (strain 28A) TaxID=671987 RepID=R0J5N3_EXST2|nr:uncharacterized protein SETTUDRAFT_30682 [Exserohilum turcica Et28A]EOA92215.1 hypothetical protein SETTUDRAFT_30682 [Exserohilum turcica Et28A]
MSIFFLACVLAICLPILSVQLPRLFRPHPKLSTSGSTHETESRPPLYQRTPSLRRRLRSRRATASSQSSRAKSRREATDGADSGTGASETGSEEIHIQPTSPTKLLSPGQEGKGKERADGKEPGRKPWDPPFPRRVETKDGIKERGTWRIMPPTPPRKSGREMEANGVARRLFPADSNDNGGHIDEEQPPRRSSEAENQTVPVSVSPPTQDPVPESVALTTTDSPKAKKRHGKKDRVMSGVWLCLGILGFLLFLFIFAILIAHCLAWFLVYKTEARLGDARRGIMKSGDMRLCLCAS